MGEGIAEADDRVVFAVHILVQPAPVGMDGLQQHVTLAAVFECLDQHFRIAVRAGDVEAGLHQLHRMKTGAGGDVENLVLAAGLENIDEEGAFAFRPGIPVDEFVPFFDEGLHIFGLVMIGFASFQRIIAEILGFHIDVHSVRLPVIEYSAAPPRRDDPKAPLRGPVWTQQ